MQDPASGATSSDDEVAELRWEVARLRVENLELRDALQGLPSYERSATFLLHENQRLMDLVRHPWRAARIKLRSLMARVRRRIASVRSPN